MKREGLARNLLVRPAPRGFQGTVAGFHIAEVPIKYTVGGGEGVDRLELIISSWDGAAEPVGQF